jgi:hypothetical protein
MVLALEKQQSEVGDYLQNGVAGNRLAIAQEKKKKREEEEKHRKSVSADLTPVNWCSAARERNAIDEKSCCERIKREKNIKHGTAEHTKH